MKDIQKMQDERNITVDQVGVCDIRYPISVKDKSEGMQDTVATIDMMVELFPHFKGTHMSRFIEILNTVRGEITMSNIPDILRDMRLKLESPASHIHLNFPYFIEKCSPVSKAKSLFATDIIFSGYSQQQHGENFILGIKIPITTLCPCSKEISEFGAHNQRSYVSLFLHFKDFVWIEELVERIEKAASCAVYPLLKRLDEKYVTEEAYKRPQFAEDVVRTLTEDLINDANINWFRIQTLHLESIHSHNAYACIERTQEKSELLKNHIKILKIFPHHSIL